MIGIKSPRGLACDLTVGCTCSWNHICYFDIFARQMPKEKMQVEGKQAADKHSNIQLQWQMKKRERIIFLQFFFNSYNTPLLCSRPVAPLGVCSTDCKCVVWVFAYISLLSWFYRSDTLDPGWKQNRNYLQWILWNWKFLFFFPVNAYHYRMYRLLGLLLCRYSIVNSFQIDKCWFWFTPPSGWFLFTTLLFPRHWSSSWFSIGVDMFSCITTVCPACFHMMILFCSHFVVMSVRSSIGDYYNQQLRICYYYKLMLLCMNLYGPKML